ncbi:MAG: hypothetical protein GY877_13275 [Hyphomicrobium sp.]|nr:hypothetical protein [Hyphomicrobium sp.]
MYGFDWSDFKPNVEEHRTTARVGAAIAFADGTVAIGAPIRGDAFAIVDAHESLADKEIYVLDGDDVRARADQWGPALVSQLPAYTDVTLPIDVEDLPIGCSLDAGVFDLLPAYRSGQVL